CSAGSATEATSTTSESPRACRWLRPILPAPARPNLKTATALEASGFQELAIRALVAGGRAQRIVGVGQHVLLDHEPTLIATAQGVEDRLDVEVALAQPAEGLALPDLGHRQGLADDLVDHRTTRVFQVHVVDAR